MDLIKTGKFLAQLRREAGDTQEQLGEKLGVSNKTVSRWEKGAYLPPVEMLQAISGFPWKSGRHIIKRSGGGTMPRLWFWEDSFR